jgi:hypothetical protein
MSYAGVIALLRALTPYNTAREMAMGQQQQLGMDLPCWLSEVTVHDVISRRHHHLL